MSLINAAELLPPRAFHAAMNRARSFATIDSFGEACGGSRSVGRSLRCMRLPSVGNRTIQSFRKPYVQNDQTEVLLSVSGLR